MIKAIFFDIDGTLVSFKTHRIPESTIKALALVREKGIKVFIATGRHQLAINNLGNEQFDGLVTMNGSYCINETGRAVYKHKIPAEDIAALLNYQENVEPFPCILVQEKSMLLNYKNEHVQRILDMLNFPEPPSGNLRDVPMDDVYQLIAFFEEHQEARIMRVLPGCESTRWSPLFTDVVPKGSNKSVGIDKLLDSYGITPQETMAFGDGGNDMAMLKHVGLGVAMGNADDEVKSVADYVTDGVDNDGIYNALKYFELI
jgi:Cof subfamily protein (haloacid dehalogenase superfamily)